MGGWGAVGSSENDWFTKNSGLLATHSSPYDDTASDC